MLQVFTLLWFLSLSLARGEQWVGLGRTKSRIKGSGIPHYRQSRHTPGFVLTDLIRPSAPNEVAPFGAEPVGMFERKTQSPMTWCSPGP